MAIAFRSSAFVANNTAGTSVSPALPSGLADNDVLIAVIAYRDGDTNVSAPGGWTQLPAGSPQETGTGSADVGLAVYYRAVATAASESAPTFTLSLSQRNVGALLAYSGVDTSNPIDDSDGQTNA